MGSEHDRQARAVVEEERLVGTRGAAVSAAGS